MPRPHSTKRYWLAFLIWMVVFLLVTTGGWWTVLGDTEEADRVGLLVLKPGKRVEVYRVIVVTCPPIFRNTFWHSSLEYGENLRAGLYNPAPPLVRCNLPQLAILAGLLCVAWASPAG